MSPGSGGGYMAVPAGRSRRSESASVSSRRDTLRLQTVEELGVSLEEYRQSLAKAKLIGAMRFMQMGKVGIEPRHVRRGKCKGFYRLKAVGYTV